MSVSQWFLKGGESVAALRSADCPAAYAAGSGRQLLTDAGRVSSWHREAFHPWRKIRKGEWAPQLEPFATAYLFEDGCYFCSVLFFFFLLGSHVCIYCMIICFLFLLCRLIFQIGLKWNFTEITFSKSPIGGSCLWKDRMSWKLDCGLNSNQRKVLTMGAWPENGSSCCPKRCSTPTTVSLSTPQRKSQVTWRALRMGPRRNSFSLKELKRDEKIAAQAFEMR